MKFIENFDVTSCFIREYIQMKQAKAKPFKNQLAQQFRDKCKQQLKQQPKNYLSASLRDNGLSLDLSIFNPDDIIFFQVAVSLPISKIHIFVPEPQPSSPSKNKNTSVQLQTKAFHQTPKFRDFVKIISNALHENTTVKVLRLERIPLSLKAVKELSQGIKRTTTLREIGLMDCRLNEQHLQSLKLSLAENKSLITLDLSRNQFVDIGGMIGHILSEHSRRRTDMIWHFNIRGETPAQDISNIGLCEVNLERNQLNDKAVIELISYLKNDSWTKCINLRGNQIHSQGIREFALMLKNNTSLISLDLRDNEGLTREYSRYIYKKLLLNMEKYKQQKLEMEKNKAIATSQQRSQAQSRVESTVREYNSHDHQQANSVQLKSLRRQPHFLPQTNQYSIVVENKKVERNNMTVNQKKQNAPQSHEKVVEECSNCKQKTFEMLRLEKKNLDLQLQLRKVRHALLTKNIDISLILPVNATTGNNSLTELLSMRYNENDDELLQRMELIMLQLTRVMQNIEEQQNTKENMSNPLDNPNSFSNTVQLYAHNSHFQELSKEIEEDRLQSIFEASNSTEQKIDNVPI